MRVAIAGAGNVGLFIARDLAPAGHEVQIIEQNEEVVKRADPIDGVLRLEDGNLICLYP